MQLTLHSAHRNLLERFFFFFAAVEGGQSQNDFTLKHVFGFDVMRPGPLAGLRLLELIHFSPYSPT